MDKQFSMNVVAIGEVLWDVIGDSEHLGGAPFNFSAHLARLGHNVSFVSAVGKDSRGQRILESMPALGLTPSYVHALDAYPTGVVLVSVDAAGVPKYTLQRPAAYDFPELSGSEVSEIFSRPVDWIYFGTLLHISPSAKRTLHQLLNASPETRRFYDVNLRPQSWTPELVRELMGSATVVKLNDEEAVELSRVFGDPLETMEKFCRSYAAKFHWEGVCVTRGPQGCCLLLGDRYWEMNGYQVQIVDTVGAGDAFAAAFLHGLSHEWEGPRIADFANRLGAFVASRPGALPAWTMSEIEAMHQKSENQSRDRESA